jgi:hypothetical protein
MQAEGEIVSGMLGYLAGIPLFSKLTETLCLQLAHRSRFKRVDKGEILFLQHDASEADQVPISSCFLIYTRNGRRQ